MESGDFGGKPIYLCADSSRANTPNCASSSECKPGFACVGKPGASECLPYCCSSSTVCRPGTFCAQRSLLEKGNGPDANGANSAALRVPVCAQAIDCKLGDDSSCSPGETCTVVSTDNGLTGCVVTGPGRLGAACPCAAGYFCSQASNTCVKICRTSGDDSCQPGNCQTTYGFPDGFGLCVGAAPAIQ